MGALTIRLIAVILDLMQPDPAARNLGGARRDAGLLAGIAEEARRLGYLAGPPTGGANGRG